MRCVHRTVTFSLGRCSVPAGWRYLIIVTFAIRVPDSPFLVSWLFLINTAILGARSIVISKRLRGISAQWQHSWLRKNCLRLRYLLGISLFFRRMERQRCVGWVKAVGMTFGGFQQQFFKAMPHQARCSAACVLNLLCRCCYRFAASPKVWSAIRNCTKSISCFADWKKIDVLFAVIGVCGILGEGMYLGLLLLYVYCITLSNGTLENQPDVSCAARHASGSVKAETDGKGIVARCKVENG